MGGVDLNLFYRPDLRPAAASDSPARKNERMRLIFFDNGKLKIAVEWCARDGLPH